MPIGSVSEVSEVSVSRAGSVGLLLVVLASACTEAEHDRGGGSAGNEPRSAAAGGAAGIQHGLPPQPLAGIDKAEARLTFASSDLRGEAAYHMAERQVTIVWRVTYTPGAPTDPHLSVQTESASYWLTEVSGAGPGRLAVAGKDPRTGHTVVELWTFTPPDRLPAPSIEPASGQTVYPSIRVPITTRRVVLDASEKGRDLVRVLFPNHVVERELLVQFWDSRDLYALDVETGALTLLLSATPGGGAPHEPALANDYVKRWSARHAAQGDCYFLSPEGDGSLDLLALFDHDLDGGIDEHRTLTREEFRQLGLADGLQYERYY